MYCIWVTLNKHLGTYTVGASHCSELGKKWRIRQIHFRYRYALSQNNACMEHRENKSRGRKEYKSLLTYVVMLDET